jgi:capsular exopolysaccharide synthesis family protein
VLAVVPEADLSKLTKGGNFLTEDSNSSQAESFRTLRASLSLLGEEDQRRLILVTSAIPAEGKTFTALNLAASLATQGLRTLMIDGDLRRPALSALLLEPDERKGTEFRGLTDVLSNLCSAKEAIRSTAIQNLDLLPSGRRAPNPAELLAQPNVVALLKQLTWEYDRVVIDSPPVNAVSDSLTLAPQMHAVVLVMRCGKTPRRATIRAIALLQKAGARMAGLVMNRMATHSGAAYYYYYYGDSYVNDTVYSEEDKKDKKNRKKSKAGKA